MINKSESYFGSANGFSGFRSYFDSLFSSREFDKIYVLKGGPGTGKNTLMKKIANLEATNDFQSEKFYCSSDPSSLDAIILSSNQRHVGILDATAPHERDAVIPGAIDSIVNLCENLHESALEKERERILTINDRKKEAYRKGYFYLSLAGKMQKEKKNPEKLADAYKEIADGILKNVTEKGAESLRLLSAFCHLGSVRLPFSKPVTSEIKIDADKTHADYFMNILLMETRKKNLPVIRFVSPFDENMLEGLYLPKEKWYITAISDTPLSENRVCLSLPSDPTLTDNRIWDESTEAFIAKAQECFSEASRAHFELEEIYKTAMNYKKNEALANLLSDRICEILLKP